MNSLVIFLLVWNASKGNANLQVEFMYNKFNENQLQAAPLSSAVLLISFFCQLVCFVAASEIYGLSQNYQILLCYVNKNSFHCSLRVFCS